MQKRKPPLPDDIAKVLADLLGRAVTAKASAPLAESRAAVFALFGDKSGSLGAAVACDLAAAANLGAALSMIPPSRAQEVVRAGALDATLAENVREVFNVASGLFNFTGVGHQTDAQLGAAGLTVSLTKFLTVPPAVPPPLVAMLKKCPGRVDLDLAITGYGAGKIAIYVV